MGRLERFFDSFARSVSQHAGRPPVFALALLTIIVWAMLGPIAGFSDTWQLVINTSTTIVTFLMVFLIQHSQNRDTESMNLKLDELIRAIQEASNEFIDIEEMEEEDLQRLLERNRKLAALARATRKSTAPADSAAGEDAPKPD